MTTATISYQSDGSARLYTPFDPGFVEQLKARIPAALRRWDKADKSWVIEAAGIFRAVSLAEQYYDEVVDIPTTPPEPQRFRPVTPYATLYLLPDAPLGLVETAYRWLVKEHHPDTGGDTRRMQEINAAREAIKGMQR